MFRGEYFHSIDIKGRLIVPSKFRDELSDQFILTKGLDKCLFAFAMEEWRAIERKTEDLPMTDVNARRFMRFFFGAAFECERDAQGRALVPPNLRAYAGIQKDIVSVGVGKRIEIWSKEYYDEYFGGELDMNTAAHMAALGI